MSDEIFDTPEDDEVYQSDDIGNAVPVEVKNVVRVDEMPTITAYSNKVLLAGSGAEKILNADPRRKKVILWAVPVGVGVDGIMAGGNQGEAQSFRGAFLYINNPGLLRYELTTCDEVWVRPCIANDDGAGTWTGYVISTDDVILSMVIEQWAH